MKYSKLILDEIQSYEPVVIAIIIYGLKTIQEMGGRFAIITATFPPVLKHFMEENGLIENKQYIFKDFTGEEYLTNHVVRHKIRIRKSEMDIDEILEQGRNKKVLVICNTVSQVQRIYKEIQEKSENVYLLHSRYIRRDRAFMEKQIMDFAESEEAGIWITTQIVEASLDIDFDVLHKEMCTADSLLQRMGRCNRKGRYFPEEANVIIYDNRNGVGKNGIYDSVMYDRSLKLLAQYENLEFVESMKTTYMNQVYDSDEIKETGYYEEIEKCLNKLSEIHPVDYKLKDAEIRKINSITVVPEEIYQEKMDLFECGTDFLRKSNVSKETKSLIRSKLEDMTLNLSIYKNKYPENVDRVSVGFKNCKKVTDIHRIEYKYEFDPRTGKGRGLLTSEILEQCGYFM